MFKFVLEKLLHKKWIILCLLIGNVLLAGIASCNPMYMRASLQKMLTGSLNAYLEEKNEYPLIVDLAVAINPVNMKSIESPFFKEIDKIPEKTKAMFGLPVVQEIDSDFTRKLNGETQLSREGLSGEKHLLIGHMTDLDQHVRMIGGQVYEKKPDAEGIIDGIVSHRALVESELIVGDVIDFPEVKLADGEVLRIRIKGVFEASSAEDTYWVKTPSDYREQVFIDSGIFAALFFENGIPNRSVERHWTYLFDFTEVTTVQAENMLEKASYIVAEADKTGYTSAKVNFKATLENYLVNAGQLQTTMWILLAPIFVLLAAFIFMVSRQILDIEQSEIAVMKSRGVSKGQIVTVYLLQSVLLSVISTLIGIPLGYGICMILGDANAFMEFVGRKALDVRIDTNVILYAAVAAVFSIAVMTIPVFKHSKVSIVEEKQRKSKNPQPFWQKMYLDVILFAVSMYGLYNFNNQKELLAEKISVGQALDPLLFLNSSLFIFSVGLLSLRIIPLITKIIFLIGKRLWSPALYASFLHVLRTRRKQGFITVFLVLTIAMGIFNANTARTINKNEADRISYDVGTDVVLQEFWKSNASLLASNPNMELVYEEPDYWKYKNLEGIESVTRVIRDKNISVFFHGPLEGVELMAIHTREFGETAWMRNDALDANFYEYLNCISQNPKAVLISENMKTKMGIELGDVIYFDNARGKSATGIVSGFIKAWPTYSATERTIGEDNKIKKTDHYLIVANFDQIWNDYGVTPYEVWIKTKGSTAFLYDFIETNQMKITKFNDAQAELRKLKNNPVFQVTNGVLTINFIIVLILCSSGFLIYWISSIRSRELLFGVYRAMGMSMREVWSMLINEHIFISLLSIGIGALVGVISARLFVPLIEMAYSPVEHTLPTLLISSAQDMVQLTGVIGVMLVFCLAVLGALISRIKISQALKLGEE